MISSKVPNCCINASAEAFRNPLSVNKILIFRNSSGETGYYMCPRCEVSLERDFVSYCDRCGQALDWKHYKKATPIFPQRYIKVIK